MMRITHLCLAGTITDGWSYQENLLSKYHAKLGYDVSIITARWVYNEKNELYKFPQNDYFLKNGIRVLRLEIKNKDQLTYKFKKYIGVESALEKTSPDILFIHGCQFLDISRVVRYLNSHKETIVYVDNHADFSNSATNFLSKKILHGLIWRKCAHAIEPYTKKFYGVLPARVEFLERVYKLPKGKCELLVMGADDDAVKAASKSEVRKEIRKKYNICDNDFLIISGGKIDNYKRQTLFLMDAVNALDDLKVKLIVFGSVIPELKDEVEKRCSDHVQYIGWIKADESYQYFASCELACFPGRHSVFWEQVAGLGIPMLVKDWPGTHHIDMGGNVKFIEKDSVQEIEEKLRNIIEKDYDKMKFEAKTKAMNNFSYLEIAKRSIEKGN